MRTLVHSVIGAVAGFVAATLGVMGAPPSTEKWRKAEWLYIGGLTALGAGVGAWV